MCFTQSARVRLPVTVIVLPFTTGSGEALTVTFAQRLTFTPPEAVTYCSALSPPPGFQSCVRAPIFQVVASLPESRS
ncbi:hypothetical protein [Streptomyces sp. NBC_00111]|uniref:hypothetical protein n=1 Tax=Streptomyces sp. NBC_00111 TaxID=2975655 RepID=UPI0038680750